MKASRRTRRALAVVALAVAGTVASAPPALADAPVSVVSPTISGKPRVGETLTAGQGEWEGEPTAFFYQWLRCDAQGANCSAVAGATDPQYAVTAADLGSRIRVEVIASNADGASPAQRSAATKAVKVQRPGVLAKPAISGIAREGDTLTASTGQWSGSPTAFEYQWKRCANGKCTAAPGAVAQTYLLTGADVGVRMRVRVEASNAGGSRAAQSKSTQTVVAATSGFKLGPPRKDLKRGLARFRVEVPSAGVLKLARTAKVRPDTRRAAGPRTVKLTVKPRGRARQRLHRRGKVRVKIRVTFASDAGPATQLRRKLNLRAK